MANRKKLDYCEVYDYLKEHTIQEGMARFNASDKALKLVKNIGDALLSRQQSPLESFTPRELMMELANRGYRGNLTYTQTINISNF